MTAALIRARSVEAYGLRQVTDVGAIDSAVDAVIAANPDKAEQAKTKPGMLGWFVGQVMKSTGGKANPQAVSDALKKQLGCVAVVSIAAANHLIFGAIRAPKSAVTTSHRQKTDSNSPRKIRLR